jgi:dTDP-4-dehydrorhamnose reductase
VRILVLGGDGMLGHQLVRTLSRFHDVRTTLRRPLAEYGQPDLFSRQNTVDGLDAGDWPRLAEAIRKSAPETVVNAIGIVKQRKDAISPIPSLEINALLPHRLAELCGALGARLIHFSTDCVFSGRKGAYRETDEPDPQDLYGRSKLLGEVGYAPGLTLRTSIIGRELARKTGLVEWFLAQRGPVRGFRRAIYSGLTTIEMSRLVARLATEHADLHGVWHVASRPITKYELLVALATKLGRTDVEIVPDDEFVCDRSMRSEPFEAATGYQPPTWDAMLTELAAETRQTS